MKARTERNGSFCGKYLNEKGFCFFGFLENAGQFEPLGFSQTKSESPEKNERKQCPPHIDKGTGTLYWRTFFVKYQEKIFSCILFFESISCDKPPLWRKGT